MRSLSDDRLGDLILDGEHVRHLAVVALRPEVIAVGRAYELRRDADPVAGLAHTPFQDVLHIELGADLADVPLLAPERK